MTARLDTTTTETTYRVVFEPPEVVHQSYGGDVEIDAALVITSEGREPHVNFYGYALTKNGKRHGASTRSLRYIGRDSSLHHLALDAAGVHA